MQPLIFYNLKKYIFNQSTTTNYINQLDEHYTEFTCLFDKVLKKDFTDNAYIKMDGNDYPFCPKTRGILGGEKCEKIGLTTNSLISRKNRKDINTLNIYFILQQFNELLKIKNMDLNNKKNESYNVNFMRGGVEFDVKKLIEIILNWFSGKKYNEEIHNFFYKIFNKSYFEIGKIQGKSIIPISNQYHFYLLVEFSSDMGRTYISIPKIIRITNELFNFMNSKNRENLEILYKLQTSSVNQNVKKSVQKIFNEYEEPSKPIIDKYKFDPYFINKISLESRTNFGTNVYNVLKKIFKTKIIGEDINNTYAQMQKDFPERQYTRDKKFLGKNVVNDEVKKLSEKIFIIVRNYYRKGFYGYGQNWVLPVGISYIMGDFNINKSLEIFSQIYPYYAFLSLETFYKISLSKFIEINYMEIFLSHSLGMILINPTSPLMLKTYDNSLINRNSTGLKEIFYFSNYSNQKTLYYYQKYGMIFMFFAIYLPDLLYWDAFINGKVVLPDLLEMNNMQANQIKSDITTLKIILDYLLQQKNIVKRYEEMIEKYFGDYLKFVESVVIYGDKDLQTAKRNIMRDANLSKNTEKAKKINKYFDSPIVIKNENANKKNNKPNIINNVINGKLDIYGQNDEKRLDNINILIKKILTTPIINIL